MINKQDKNDARQKRHGRIRNKISGTSLRPRLSVYRSTGEIYAQLIDDEKGVTLASASTLDKEVKPLVAGKTKTEQAELVGKKLAERALKLKLKQVVFDRGGYLYIGRVKALADAARAEGLEF